MTVETAPYLLRGAGTDCGSQTEARSMRISCCPPIRFNAAKSGRRVFRLFATAARLPILRWYKPLADERLKLAPINDQLLQGPRVKDTAQPHQ
jgi:hypothetical protein